MLWPRFPRSKGAISQLKRHSRIFCSLCSFCYQNQFSSEILSSFDFGEDIPAPSYSSDQPFSVSFLGASSFSHFLYQGNQLAIPSQPHPAHNYVLFDIFSILKEFEFIMDSLKMGDATRKKKEFRHFLID